MNNTMPDVDERYDTSSAIQTFCRLASVTLGTLVPPNFSYHTIKRLISFDEEDGLEPQSDDPLAELLVEASDELGSTVIEGSYEVEVDPSASLATLFAGSFGKGAKARLFLAFDLRDAAKICGFLTCCEWTRDASLGNERFNQSYCASNKLPRFGSGWLFIDVVASAKAGSGALLVLQAYLLACRARRYEGVCAVCVTKKGRSLFQSLGFELHGYREGAPRTLAYATAGSLSMRHIMRRLRFEGSDELLQETCYRLQITHPERSIVARC